MRRTPDTDAGAERGWLRRPDLRRDRRRIETTELFVRLRATDDPEERDRLSGAIAELNLDVVRAVARRYRSRGQPLEDLEQVGCLGLVKAINNFRPEQGADFLAYAVPTITGEVKRHFRDRSWAIRPTRAIQELQVNAAAAAADLRQALGHEPSVGELAAHLDEDEHMVRRAVDAHVCYASVSLDNIVTSGDMTFAGAFGMEDGGFSTAEARAILAPALRRLTDDDRHILSLRFYRGLSQREIGAETGLSQMQVSRTLARLLVDLRQAIEGEALGVA
jgi:RNA polymerase sigma-B factor